MQNLGQRCQIVNVILNCVGGLAPLNSELFKVSCSSSFLEFYIRRIIQYGLLVVWLLQLSIIISEIKHVACISSSFLFTAEQCSIIWVYYNYFIHLPAEGQFAFPRTPPPPPPVWAIEITAAMNVQVFVFVWTYALLSLGSITRSGLFRSYGVIFICFSFFKNLSTAFQSIHSRSVSSYCSVFWTSLEMIKI